MNSKKIISVEYFIGDHSRLDNWDFVYYRKLIRKTTYISVLGFNRTKFETVAVSPRYNFVSKHPSWDKGREDIEKWLEDTKKLFEENNKNE